MIRENSKRFKSFKGETTDARNWDGVTRSSEEVFVMNVERRSYVRQSNLLFN
jgi:hypothetical protein